MSSVTATPSNQIPTIVIKPSTGWIALKLNEVWEYRELLYFLVWRDIKVRYKQTALGAAWAIIQPVFSMIVFSIFFGRLAKMPSSEVSGSKAIRHTPCVPTALTVGGFCGCGK